MTPDQEDSILQAMRPLCPMQTPEQLREVIRQTVASIPKDLDGEALQAELARRFPKLRPLFGKVN